LSGEPFSKIFEELLPENQKSWYGLFGHDLLHPDVAFDVSDEPRATAVRPYYAPSVRYKSTAEANKRKKGSWSAQPIGKAHFGQGNPRKSKPFSLIFFGLAWLDLAGFG